MPGSLPNSAPPAVEGICLGDEKGTIRKDIEPAGVIKSRCVSIDREAGCLGLA
jgi:hypothetical protein